MRDNRIELSQRKGLGNSSLKKPKKTAKSFAKHSKTFKNIFKNVAAFNELQKKSRYDLKQDELVKSTELRLEKMRKP